MSKRFLSRANVMLPERFINETDPPHHGYPHCRLRYIDHLAFAQFSGNVSGIVTDASGAVISGASLTLRNVATAEKRSTTANTAGFYQFVSLAPGDYEVSTTMSGFSASRVSLTLQTNQTLNLPIAMAVGSSTETVQVTSQAPVLDTADTRLQETISTQTLSQLPLAGRNMISLVTLAPGVTGTGVTSNGSPGSGRDNFSTETQVDASANGQGAVGNMYISWMGWMSAAQSGLAY